MREFIEELRQSVYMYDVPHPTIEEYRILHKDFQSIIRRLDNMIVNETYDLDDLYSYISNLIEFEDGDLIIKEKNEKLRSFLKMIDNELS